MSDHLTEAERRLRKLASKATPDWSSSVGASMCTDDEFDFWFARGPMKKLDYQDGRDAAGKDAKYIAAANPQDILSLLASLSQERDENARLRAGLSTLESHLRHGASLSQSSGQWWLFRTDGEGLECGDTLAELVEKLSSWLKAYDVLDDGIDVVVTIENRPRLP